ncbi:MAG TPA: PPC domain-containing DNA-binding protein [Rhodothermales bacterium]|nr:PPC domain-containing DNA-binding protein [Rhodothermales bacterium]
MQSKLIYEDGKRTFALVFDEGDEAIAGIEKLAEEHNLHAAHLTAIGAFRKATLGYFDYGKKDYTRIPVDGQVEVLSFIGNVSRYKGRPKVHVHVVLGRSDGSTLGGHLLEADVRPTLEVVVTEEPGYLRRTVDETTGLPLLNLQT